jgi:hypothetical protein
MQDLTGAIAPGSTNLRRTIVLAAVAMTALALLGPAALPAAAHTHPTPVDVSEPAVVRVETYVQVFISLIEHDRHGKHIGLYQKRYELLGNAGSGFAVDPSGVIVAAGGVIEADTKKAEVEAVNRIFHDRYGGRAPIPPKPDARYRIRRDNPDDPLNGRLQRCYAANTADTTGGCVIATSKVVRVYPYVTSQERFGNLDATVLYPKTGKATVSVLQVGANSMPTVDLASSTVGTEHFTALGFTEVPEIPAGPASAKDPVVNKKGHLLGIGPEIKRDEFRPQLSKAIIAGVWGGPVVGTTGRVSGFLAVRQNLAHDPYLTGVQEIRKALAAAKIQPRRGPTDTVYLAALHNYNNQAYRAAIPSLNATLDLYPGHALARKALDVAKQRQGTAADKSGRGSGVKGISVQTGGWPLRTVAMVAGVLAVLALVLFGAMRRGRLRPALAGLRNGGDGDLPSDSRDPPAQRPAARPAPRTTPRDQVAWPPAGAQATPVPGGAPVATAGRRAPARGGVGFCTECGGPLGRDHKYCGFCGHKAR